MKLSFSTVGERLQNFLTQHRIPLQEALFSEFLDFLSRACTYEEENKKIKPSLIVGSGLTRESFIKIAQATVIPFTKEKAVHTHLGKRLKSILPFCNNGWRVFISIDSDDIVYGIMRNFTGPTGFTLEEILLDLSKEESDALGINFLLVDIVNQYRLRLKNYSDSCEIDFRLTDDPSNSEEDRENFCRDLLRATEDDRDKIKSAYKKVIDLFPDRLHGSLCLIVKRDYALPDDVIRDGVFLEQPVEIDKVLAELNDDKYGVDGVVSAHAKYHALTGLFLEMLNIDGITVADDAGRLRAFNVFVKSDVDGEESVAGGARKRAAEFLCRQTNENYVGVYFQSQDGTCFYRRIGNHE